MVDRPFRTNGEVKPPFSFAEKVHRDWIKSESPEKIVRYGQTEDVCIFWRKSPLCRLTTDNASYNWNFWIVTRGKQLQRVALTLDQNRRNFALKSVIYDSKEIGVTNGQEWYNSELETVDANGNGKEQSHYFIDVHFAANRYGTYRQRMLLYFGDYPVLLQNVCVDCLPIEDLTRIEEATDYQFTQNPNAWNDGINRIQWFESPFVAAKDPKEERLSMIYLYPNKHNFFLTQETLTDERLTAENYRGRLHELINVEELARHEQIARYNETSYMRLLNHYVLTLPGDASTIAKYAPPGELFAQLPLSRGISEDTKSGRLFLRGCNKVLFKSKCPQHVKASKAIFEAHIEDKCTHTVYVRLSKECVQTLNVTADSDLHVQVQFLLNRLPYCEWHKAVDSLPDIGLVFLGKDHVNMNDRQGFAQLLERNASNVRVPLLNDEQKKAVAVITASVDVPMPPILLLGPFGTGKTFTIAQALRLLLTGDSEHKILLCTHSNSAADLYVKEFFDVWYKAEKNPRLKPVRIYYKGRARNTVHPVVQEYSLMRDNGTFRDPTDEDLNDCGLVVTTLATSSSLTSLNLSFTHIVIDEAAQALECEVLIPLALATPRTRLVLAGDQMQLAPEIYSDLAYERGLGISLLERIYGMYPAAHPCRIHLDQNYRAHDDIVRFTSEAFYEGLVEPAGKNLLRHPVLKPLTFYAVQGVEIQDSTGYANMNEVYELVTRVQELRNSWPTDRWGAYGEKSIGVLAYYAEQVQRIRAELREHRLADVSVERVLNVQGKQFTAIFISTVRTGQCCRYSAERNVNDYGFLTNPRLLNTALTRAKCMVAVVGDPIALSTIGSCRKLWQRYLEVADLRNVDRNTLQNQLTQIPELPSVAPLNPLAREFVPRRYVPMVEYVPVPVMYPVFHPFYST
ncbi:probable helicase with zinc finger domain isoform X1 [Ceratina calcarata]|uniref:Probable helicase with zinc finger domain isoform X1 n=1 Tax=Ceratina calcarata TaxID=156304 RepID=A0AAJ7N6K8_9HYME|nr:probable helicase with zinc finger domain isoform X1 [Ceratina calcarata]